jgi:cell division protein FtsL
MPANLSLHLHTVSHTLFARNRKVTQAENRWAQIVLAALILATVGIMVTSLIWAWGNFQIVTLNYQVSQAQEIQKQYRELNDKLKIELSNLKGISRLEKLAAAYGMNPPQPSQVIYLP